MIDVFVGFLCIFLLGILIFKEHTLRRLCKSFGVKGLSSNFVVFGQNSVPVPESCTGTAL
jgi:hypothetical protein